MSKQAFQSQAGLLAALLTSTLACKPKNASAVKDIATASTAKTGMFMPEPADTNNRLAASLPAKLTADQLAGKLGVSLNRAGGRQFYTVETADGMQVLIGTIGLSYPVPVGALSATGIAMGFAAPTLPLKGGGAILSELYVAVAAGQPVKASVSSDGNTSNIYEVRRVLNGSHFYEPFLVSYLYTLQAGTNLLLRIGNNIVDAKTGVTALQFVEQGNQIWQVIGSYRDAQFTQGSVVWSPDLKTFYSQKSVRDPLFQWTKQDQNSMALVGTVPLCAALPAADCVVRPLPALNLLRTPTDKELASTPQFGPNLGLVTNGATSLFRRADAQAGGLGLADATQPVFKPRAVAPAQSADDYSDFYDLGQARRAGLSLGAVNGQFVPPTNTNIYSKVGLPLNFQSAPDANGRIQTYGGTIAMPGGSKYLDGTTPVDNYNRPIPDATVNFLDTGNGAITQVVTSKSLGQTFIRPVNAGDLQNQAAVAASTDTTALQQQFQQQTQQATQTAAVGNDLANQFQYKYGTVKGLATNVALPLVATTGGEVLGDTIENAPNLKDAGGAQLANFAKVLTDSSADTLGTVVDGDQGTVSGQTSMVGSSLNLVLSPLSSNPLLGTAGDAVAAVGAVADSRNTAEGVFNTADALFGNNTAGAIPGVGLYVVPAKIAVQGGAAIAANLQAASQFDTANQTADQILAVGNSSANANAGLSYLQNKAAAAAAASRGTDPSAAAPTPTPAPEAATATATDEGTPPTDAPAATDTAADSGTGATPADSAAGASDGG